MSSYRVYSLVRPHPQTYSSATISDEGYKTLGELRAAEQQFDLQWVELGADNPLIDSSIAEAEIRKNTGVSVVGILREGKLAPNPEPSFRFCQGDLVAIIGSAEARLKFHCFLNPLATECLIPRQETEEYGHA